MRVTAVLWALLSIPVAVVVVFVGLALSAWTTYTLSDLSKKLPEADGGQAREVLRPALRPWWQIRRARWARSRREAITSTTGEVVHWLTILSLAGMMGALAAMIAIAPLVITLDLRELTPSPWLGRSVVPLGGIAGIASLIHVLWYWSRRTTTAQRFTPPVLPLPRGEIGSVKRAEFLRSVYLFTQLRLATGIALILGVLGPAFASADGKSGTARPPERLGEFKEESQALYEMLWYSGAALGAGVALLLARLVNSRMPAANAAVALHRCLNPDHRTRGSTRHSGIVDPFGGQRAQLERATRALDAIGRRVDLVRFHHPVASVLHGCAQHLRRFLARADSVAPNYPAEVRQVLRDAIAVVAGAVRPDFLRRVGHTVGAFDDEGTPESSLRTKSVGRWASLVARVADSVDKYSRLGNSVWAIIILLVVAYLLVTGKLDLTKVQLQE